MAALLLIHPSLSAPRTRRRVFRRGIPSWPMASRSCAGSRYCNPPQSPHSRQCLAWRTFCAAGQACLAKRTLKAFDSAATIAFEQPPAHLSSRFISPSMHSCPSDIYLLSKSATSIAHPCLNPFDSPPARCRGMLPKRSTSIALCGSILPVHKNHLTKHVRK